MDIYKLADASLHEVAGILASEDLDRDGEKFDYDGSKAFFQKWSNDLYEATKKTAQPGEESYGNVRLMHTNRTVGKLIKIVYDDVKKTIWGIAKVTDDKIWDDIQKGVYSAFSIAGKLIRQVVKQGKTWITVKPLEVSIVDYPSNPSTTFDWARGASFAKFADPAFAPNAVPDQGDPSPGPVEQVQPKNPNEDKTLEIVRPNETDTQNSDKPESQALAAHMIGLDSDLANKNKISNPNSGAEQMSTETEKLAAIEASKAARKSLHDHFAAIKAKASAHAAECGTTACAKHAADVHELVDKCMKLAGEPDFSPDTEHAGGQPAPGDANAATDTTVKAAMAEIEKLAKSVAELTKKLETKEELKEKAAKSDPVVGDPKDAVKTGEDAVAKAAAAKVKEAATLDLAKAAMGVDKDGKRIAADPKAMSALYDELVLKPRAAAAKN